MQCAGKGVRVLELSGNFDRTTALNTDIENGAMTVTVAQQPAKIGKIALQAVCDHFNGKIVKKIIDSPIYLVTKKNTHKYKW